MKTMILMKIGSNAVHAVCTREAPLHPFAQQINALPVFGGAFLFCNERIRIMKIIDFTKEMIPDACRLAMENYAEECKAVPALPEEVYLPPFDETAENGQIGRASCRERV